MLASWRITPALCVLRGNRSGFCCRAAAFQGHENGGQNNDERRRRRRRQSLLSLAGLGAAQHLCKQRFDITVLDGGNGFGSRDDVYMQGFWYPYQNIFSLVDELGIKPFTPWMKSAQYSEEGLEGTLREKIFEPWMDSMRTKGCEFLDGRRVTDFSYDEETGCILEVVCGKETYNADGVIFAVGISTLQELIKNSAALCTGRSF